MSLVHTLVLLVIFIVNSFAATSKEGLAWLASKEKEAGVMKRESGLLYRVITSSKAGHTPSLTSKTKCHYEGSLIDGTIFDSSYERKKPAIFAPNQVIKGWTEAMQLMKEGDIWELYLPSELAYGDRGAGGVIPPGSVLIFKLEMIEVLGGYANGE
jgi:FKBP-type peptidyl-prolyl cis-trans isomerase FklB